MRIQCCGYNHKVDIFRIKPQNNNILEEIALVCVNRKDKYITECCKKPVVEIRRLIYENKINGEYTGEVIEAKPVRLVEDRAQKYIDAIPSNMIFKQKTINLITQIENRWYLNCNKFGKIEKCYSNLSTCRDGFLPDQMEDLPSQKNKIF